MSENTNSAHIPASHRLSPPSSLDNPVHTTSDPHSSLSSIAHASSETAHTMGNQLSGDGSLKRKSKKKNKNKNDEKNKSETLSVLDEIVVGAFGESSVDKINSPNKRPAQTKSPRPVRSTYDNVNQHASNSNLCSNSALYTSDLYLDTVSRMDVSMTTSQMEAVPRSEKPYQFDTQLADDVSFSEISFNESGFITPALSTPQVKRNELQQVTTTADSVSELGKEIERTIFERLSADGESDGSKMKSEETLPLPCKQDVEGNVRHDVENSKRLEYINEEKVQIEEKCATTHTDMKTTEDNSTITSTCRELTPTNQSEEDIWSNENNKDKEKSSEIINKADWELMEKESKQSVTNNIITYSEEPTEISQRKASEIIERSKIEPNQNSSSSDEACRYDFEPVKLHIKEDFKVSPQDNSYDALEKEGAKSGHNGTIDRNICPDTLEQEQKITPPPKIAANQEADAVLMEESVSKVIDDEVKQSENQCLNEKEVGTKTITDDTVQLPENCGECNISKETEYVCEAEKCHLRNTHETAAAVIATKPLIPEEILTISEALPAEKNTSVEEQEPVCEKLIEPSNISLAKKSNILTHHPVLSKDQEKETEQNKTSCDESPKEYIHEQDIEANSIINESNEHFKNPATQEIEQIQQGVILEAESSLECSITQTTNITNDNKKEISENEQNISKTKTKKRRKRKRNKKSSSGNESSANASASESQSVSEVTEIEDNTCDLAISRFRGSDLTKKDEDNGNDIKYVSSTTGSDSPVFQHQSSVIENTNYLQDESSIPDDKSNNVSTSQIQKKEQADHKKINSKPYPFLDISCSTGALHPVTDILSDESTPTNERQNEIRAFYIPNKDHKIKSDSSHAEGTKDDNKRLNDQVDNVHVDDERTEKKNQQFEDESENIRQLNVQCEDENETHQCEDENENVFDKDEDTTVVIPRCRNGTKNTVEETVNPRLSTASEELNEIMENSSKLEKRSDQNRPHSYPKESEDLRDINENHSATSSQVSLESNNSSKKNYSNFGYLSLTDIDHNLPETLPELADLKNFLDYIKLGENQKVSESTFPYKGETNRSSPSENASSRRLSRISPAVTDRSVTESDIDISEQRDDISTDSNIFADDEDESASELLFTKTYTEPDKGGEVLVSCTVVNTAAADDNDDFWAEHSASEEVYRQIESSTKVVTTVFDNARLQMQDIHTHLQNLRLQMENLQESLDNASIFSHEYYPVDDTPESSQDFYPLEKGFIVSQEYFPKHIASVTTEEYSPAEIGPVLTKEYYSSHFGKPPFL